ncbi:hypothetical protein [Agilicoccus flavus]|uniref:hypothetical protein n=1 Tax=Agilicoccus flavus TaxID=2775968 RepID=UPI001CF69F72|nr:hypothetical protein [Agilicoccus flavus]
MTKTFTTCFPSSPVTGPIGQQVDGTPLSPESLSIVEKIRCGAAAVDDPSPSS